MSGRETGDDETRTEGDEARPKSDLEEGIEGLGRALSGAMTRLFGERVTGQKLDPERPIIGKEADEALERAGHALGKALYAAGESLKEEPTRPLKALDRATRSKDEEVPVQEGETPLTRGLRTLASGMYRSTEAVLDKVAPRKPKDPPGGEE